jgi:folate-binding protein YgfZ
MEHLPIAIADPALYDALQRGAVCFARGSRGRTLIEGAQAAAMLTGLVSNDVVSLGIGEGQYAAAPNPKGKLLTDCRIFVIGDGRLLVDVPPRAAAGWFAMLAKFLPPRLAKHRDATAELDAIGAYGPASAGAVASATGLAVDTLLALAPYAHVPLPGASGPAIVLRSPDLGGIGFDVIAAPTDLAAIRAAWAAMPQGDESLWTVGRVEAGRPEWGLDMDDGTIPQEANFDALRAISYTKGCYTGQETIARVHFRGHVNRHLRTIRSSEAIASGAVLFDGERDVGDVRSSIHSPQGYSALAMVRREVAAGTTIAARTAERETLVTVHEVPLGV